jgi:hypothetical protein
MTFQDEIDGHNFSSSETLQVITYMNYETKELVSANVKYCSLAVYGFSCIKIIMSRAI